MSEQPVELAWPEGDPTPQEFLEAEAAVIRGDQESEDV